MPNGIHTTSMNNSKVDNIANSEAVDFLQQLRTPPWILIAITPDGRITAITARSAKEADASSVPIGGVTIFTTVSILPRRR
jgi:hypothetical protein